MAVRERRDVTQGEIAEAIGITTANYSRWESGQRAPRESALAKLAAFLGVTPAYLRYGIGAPLVSTDYEDPRIGAVALTEAEQQRALRVAAKKHAPPAAKSGNGGRRRKR